MDKKHIVALTLIDILVIFISLVLGNYWYQTYYAPESYVIGNVTIDEYKPYEDTNVLDYVTTEDILFSANINKVRFSSVDGISTYEYNFEHIAFNGEENNYGIYIGGILLSKLTETAGTISGTYEMKFYDVDKQVLCECPIQVAFSSFTNKTTMKVILTEEDLGYLMKHFEANDFIITLVKNPFEIGVNIGKIDENMSALTIIDDGVETTITKEIGSIYTLPTPRLTDYTFLGWEIITGDGILDGTNLTFVEGNTTIVAKYDICDIKFNSVDSSVWIYYGDNMLQSGDSLRMTKTNSIELKCLKPLFSKPNLLNISTDAVKYSISSKDSNTIILNWSSATYFNCDLSSVYKTTDIDVSVAKSLGSLNVNIRADAPSTVVADYSIEDNGVVATYTLDEFETESDIVNMVYYVNDTAINCELTAVQTYSSESGKTWACAEASEGPYILRDIVLTTNSLSLVIDCDSEIMSNNYVLESALLYSLSADDNEGIYPFVEQSTKKVVSSSLYSPYISEAETSTVYFNNEGRAESYNITDKVTLEQYWMQGQLSNNKLILSFTLPCYVESFMEDFEMGMMGSLNVDFSIDGVSSWVVLSDEGDFVCSDGYTLTRFGLNRVITYCGYETGHAVVSFEFNSIPDIETISIDKVSYSDGRLVYENV